MTVVKEVDAGKAYKAGAVLEVVREPKYGQFVVRWKQGGNLPEELQGIYTSASLAEKAAEQYISLREAHFETLERKKAVTKGKEAHAKKKAAKEG